LIRQRTRIARSPFLHSLDLSLFASHRDGHLLGQQAQVVDCCGKTQHLWLDIRGDLHDLGGMTESEPTASFGHRLRELRLASRLTLRDLARESGSDFTHLSRLERGLAGREISRDLLSRLAQVLGPEMGAELTSVAGIVTPAAERVLADFPHALIEPALSDLTAPALRRIEAGTLANSLFLQAPARGVEGGRVNPETLGRTLGLRLRVWSGEERPAATFDGDVVTISDPGSPDDAAATPRVRFLMAHAVAHALIGRRLCDFPRMVQDEEQAVDVAAHLLCPRSLLVRAVEIVKRELEEDAQNPWTFQSGDVVAAVAERLSVPGWMALRRLAEEALLDEDAMLYYLGE
jgi:transcriptional regulator with XRE-family HTH domain